MRKLVGTINKEYESPAFRNMRHLMQQEIFSKLASIQSGTSIRLKGEVVDNPLASASLLANFIKQQMIRNAEAMTPAAIRKILGIVDPKHPFWKYSYNQEQQKKPQYLEALGELEFKKKCIKAKILVDKDERLGGELIKVEETIAKIKLICEHMQPNIQGSMHPDPGALGVEGEGFLVGSNSPWKIRGIMIRIAGARMGQRAQSWKQYAGSYSINSVNFVNAEESKIQVLTKYGIFGLTVRIVWDKIEEMPSSKLIASHEGLTAYEPFHI